MAKSTATEGKEVATDQAMTTYSIKDAAKALKRSESSVKTYKRVLLKAWNSKDFEVVTDNGSLTEIGLREIREIMKYAKQGNPEQYISVLWAMKPKLSQDNDSSYSIDQGNDQGNGYVNESISPGSSIVTVEAQSVEIETNEEIAETAAISRFNAKKDIAIQRQRFNRGIKSLRSVMKETVRQELMAGVMEGVSEGIAESDEFLSGQYEENS